MFLHISVEFSEHNEEIQESVGGLWFIELYHTKHHITLTLSIWKTAQPESQKLPGQGKPKD